MRLPPRRASPRRALLAVDLTYSVCFNLANCYHLSKMYAEAINTYSVIVKNKQYASSGRLRVNMGNIYYEGAHASLRSALERPCRL